ncbi:MAG: FHA domain-containing protein [Deltaproteobacteria bacterium]|nr:FHA domain-containing protein [Deltaproteobacteria bacterium]
MTNDVLPPTTARWIDEAHGMLRSAFAETYACPFLIGTPGLHVPRRATRTLADPSSAGPDTLPPPPRTDESARLLILPLAKRSEFFADMITVGRTMNHDVVLRDITVSKFHAYFTIESSGIWLTDAGSRNGTRLDEMACVPRRATLVSIGGTIRFGVVELTLADAGEVWERLRRARLKNGTTWRER